MAALSGAFGTERAGSLPAEEAGFAAAGDSCSTVATRRPRAAFTGFAEDYGYEGAKAVDWSSAAGSCFSPTPTKTNLQHGPAIPPVQRPSGAPWTLRSKKCVSRTHNPKMQQKKCLPPQRTEWNRLAGYCPQPRSSDAQAHEAGTPQCSPFCRHMDLLSPISTCYSKDISLGACTNRTSWSVG